MSVKDSAVMVVCCWWRLPQVLSWSVKIWDAGTGAEVSSLLRLRSVRWGKGVVWGLVCACMFWRMV